MQGERNHAYELAVTVQNTINFGTFSFYCLALNDLERERGCPEKSITNYQLTPRNTAEGRIPLQFISFFKKLIMVPG
jgi:hypothetical protein